MNQNKSYKDLCGTYRVVAAELVPAKAGSNKNDYIRLSLKKVMRNGRLQLGFSHYFNLGIKEYVDEYKRLGVTDKGISAENLAKLKQAYDAGETDAQYEYYGMYWTQEFGGVYRNKETGKISSETLIFIPCDEDTGVPLKEFCMTSARLAEILNGYEIVKQDTAEVQPTVNDADQGAGEEDERAAFEEFMRQQKAAKGGQ